MHNSAVLVTVALVGRSSLVCCVFFFSFLLAVIAVVVRRFSLLGAGGCAAVSQRRPVFFSWAVTGRVLSVFCFWDALLAAPSADVVKSS